MSQVEVQGGAVGEAVAWVEAGCVRISRVKCVMAAAAVDNRFGLRKEAEAAVLHVSWVAGQRGGPAVADRGAEAGVQSGLGEVEGPGPGPRDRNLAPGAGLLCLEEVEEVQNL